MPKHCRFSLIALLFAILVGYGATGCAHRSGPIPVMRDTRFSAPGLNSVATMRTSVRADFGDLANKDPAKAAQHMLDHLTYFLDNPNQDPVEIFMIPMDGSAKVSPSRNSEYPDRITIDLVGFPRVPPAERIRLRARNFHERSHDAPAYFYHRIPESQNHQCLQLQDVKIEAGPKDGMLRILAVTNNDIPASVFVYHVTGNRVFPMERRGTRIVFREFNRAEAGEDHRVFLEYGTCLTPPSSPIIPASLQ